MYFEDIYGNDLVSLFNVGNRPEVEFFSPSEALMYGTLFKTEYLPYKNYEPLKIVVDSERDKLLLKIYELDFSINELNLYLDIHENEKALQLFKKYTTVYKNLVNDYEKMYGPIELCSSDYSTFKWVDDPWPWQNVEEASHV